MAPSAWTLAVHSCGGFVGFFFLEFEVVLLSSESSPSSPVYFFTLLSMTLLTISSAFPVSPCRNPPGVAAFPPPEAEVFFPPERVLPCDEEKSVSSETATFSNSMGRQLKQHQSS